MGTIKIAKARAWDQLRKVEPLDLVLYAVLLLTYLWLRILIISGIQEAKIASDSVAYSAMASEPVLSSAFLAGPRPFTVPLIYKLLGDNPELIGLFQSTLSILAWSLLAICIAREARTRWLRVTSFATILAFSLSTDIVIWDWTILSESISLSLLALFIANWLWLVRDWKWYKAVLIVIVGFFWVFARDSNAYMILIIALILALVGLARRAQRRYLIVAILFVASFVAYEVSSNVSERFVKNVFEVLTFRVLPFPDRTAYFAEHGMPVTPAVMERSKKGVHNGNDAFFHDPELQEFRAWLYENGKSTFIQFFLSRPLWTALEPLQQENLETLLFLRAKEKPGIIISDPDNISPKVVAGYAPVGFSPILPQSKVPLAQIVYPKKVIYFNDYFGAWLGARWLLGLGALLLVVIAILSTLPRNRDSRHHPTGRSASRVHHNARIRRRSLGSKLGALLVAAATAIKQRNATWYIPVALIVLAYPHAVIVFHAEPMEIGRHAVQVGVQLGVGFWMLLLFGMDIMLVKALRRRTGKSEAAPTAVFSSIDPCAKLRG